MPHRVYYIRNSWNSSWWCHADFIEKSWKTWKILFFWDFRVKSQKWLWTFCDGLGRLLCCLGCYSGSWECPAWFLRKTKNFEIFIKKSWFFVMAWVENLTSDAKWPKMTKNHHFSKIFEIFPKNQKTQFFKFELTQ